MELRHVCETAIRVAEVDSAAIVVTAAATPREAVYVSDPVAAVAEELALTLGEGPGVDALAGGVVLAADITDAAFLARWPMFAPAAAQAGVRAVFAVPLQAGGIRLGVMDLYRSQPGGLDGGQLAGARILADTACALLLDLAGHGMTGHGMAGHGSSMAGHDMAGAGVAGQGLGVAGQGGVGLGGPEPVGGAHPVVHQATGMLI
ncbi:GAF domain-containing protein, partial [Allorhizocola rhizosphaerae]|uniref:GAF domain-containing protein n=1 Tax=Allorhizocola rhizosphaerae TaxID=1872709 RepID=UPI0013C32DB0